MADPTPQHVSIGLGMLTPPRRDLFLTPPRHATVNSNVSWDRHASKYEKPCKYRPNPNFSSFGGVTTHPMTPVWLTRTPSNLIKRVV